MRLPPRHRVALVLALLATLASFAVVVAALGLADGEEVRRNGLCCDVELLDYTVLQLTWLIFPLVAGAAWFSGRVAPLAVLGMAVPQWFAAHEVVARYQRSGWGDGLEVLAYAVPLGVLVLAAVVALVAALVGRARRARLTTSRR
jgi:hypothetical protein